MELIQQVALLLATSMLVLMLGMALRPGNRSRNPAATWACFAQEAGLGVLAGGFVSLAALGMVPRLPKLPWRIGETSCVFATTDIYVSDNSRPAGEKTALTGSC